MIFRGIFSALLFALAGCASLQEVDQGWLNHPAMDLHARLTPERSSYLVPFDPTSTASHSSGVCLACAH